MINLNLVEYQPRWRVELVARFAQLMGVLIHVEGFPFGSNRTRNLPTSEEMGGQTFSNPYARDATEAARYQGPLSVDR